jgi:hypothetical protein
MVTYLAATLPATPTGFGDRQPQPMPGRLRRVLARTPFLKSFPLPERIRKKASVPQKNLRFLNPPNQGFPY